MTLWNILSGLWQTSLFATSSQGSLCEICTCNEMIYLQALAIKSLSRGLQIIHFCHLIACHNSGVSTLKAHSYLGNLSSLAGITLAYSFNTITLRYTKHRSLSYHHLGKLDSPRLLINGCMTGKQTNYPYSSQTEWPADRPSCLLTDWLWPLTH